MNRYHILTIILLALTLVAEAQKRTDQPWQLDVAAGLHSFYAPVEHLQWRRPELVTTAGWGKPLGKKQAFEVTLQLGYARNNYQGDAVFLQLLGKFQPVIAQKVELGLGLGFGYRLALYPSTAHKWNGSEWIEGSPFKGIYQVPVQLSVGYRSIHLGQHEIRPYVAYQLQALLGYNPDLSPLPVSAALLGLKIQKP
ncbi:MAG TPA: hypothetical protein VGE66_04145 [Chitinophagaceae bacterium]